MRLRREAIATELRKELTAQKLTQRDVARATGLNYAKVNARFAGTRTLPIDDLYSICEFLGVDTKELLARSEDAA